MREAFEKEHDALDLRRDPEHGFYLDKLTQAYWEGAVWAYDVGMELAAAICEKLGEPTTGEYVMGLAEDCADAIRAEIKGA